MEGAPEARREPRGDKGLKSTLKISEMALFLNGEYLGECNNPGRRNPDETFVYDPVKGLSIRMNGKNVSVAADDLIRLHHDFGHMQIREIMGSNAVTCSDADFNEKISLRYRQVKDAIKKIQFVAELFGEKVTDDTVDRWIKGAESRNVQYTSGELIDFGLNITMDPFYYSFEDVQEPTGPLADAIRSLKAQGLFDLDPKKTRSGVVAMFYVYCRVKGINASREADVKAAMKDFPFEDELLEEFTDHADVRFGDSLLTACEQAMRERRTKETK